MKAICKQCGREFSILPSSVRRGRGKFCSRECSALGRTMNIDCFMEHVQKRESGCWEWVGAISRDGYGRVKHNHRGTPAHRFAYEQLVGPVAGGLLVCHRCDNPKCVRPEHLFLGTPAENSADMVLKGRQKFKRGSAHANAKLNEQQVRVVLERLRAGETQISIANDYGVRHCTISLIALGKAWRHVQ